MIERVEAPAGVLGFRLTGEITRRDYDEVLMPALREAIDGGGELRCLVVVGPEFEGYEAGTMWDDLKTGFRYGVGHHGAWRRMALVTDVEWMVKAAAIFGWMTPGELKVFPLAERDDATAWVSAP